MAAGAEVGGQADARHIGQRVGEEVLLERGRDVLLALEQQHPADDQRGALRGVGHERPPLAGRRRARGAGHGQRAEQLAAGAQWNGERGLVVLGHLAALHQRPAQRAAGVLGRAALGVGHDRASGVDHAHRGAVSAEHVVQAPAQLVDDMRERERVEVVGQRGHAGQPRGQRLGLVAGRALGRRPLERGLRAPPLAQVLDLQQDRVARAARVAHGGGDDPHGQLLAADDQPQLGLA